MTLKTLKHKVSGLRSGEDRGVSPVIGVVLMVAITVILAAVIGAFVLGLGDGLGEEATAGVSIDGDGSGGYTVTWVSQGNAEGIYIGSIDETAGPDIGQVGGSVSGSDGDSVIAVTEDGKQTVIDTVG